MVKKGKFMASGLMSIYAALTEKKRNQEAFNRQMQELEYRNQLAQQLYEAQRRADTQAEVEKERNIQDVYDKRLNDALAIMYPESDPALRRAEYLLSNPEAMKARNDTEIAKSLRITDEERARRPYAAEVGSTAAQSEIARNKGLSTAFDVDRERDLARKTFIAPLTLKQGSADEAEADTRGRLAINRGIYGPKVETSAANAAMAQNAEIEQQANLNKQNAIPLMDATVAQKLAEAAAARKAANFQSTVTEQLDPSLAATAQKARLESDIGEAGDNRAMSEFYFKNPWANPKVRIPGQESAFIPGDIRPMIMKQLSTAIPDSSGLNIAPTNTNKRVLFKLGQ